jgi:hypothetical protein
MIGLRFAAGIGQRVHRYRGRMSRREFAASAISSVPFGCGFLASMTGAVVRRNNRSNSHGYAGLVVLHHPGAAYEGMAGRVVRTSHCGDAESTGGSADSDSLLRLDESRAELHGSPGSAAPKLKEVWLLTRQTQSRTIWVFTRGFA